MVVKRYLWIHVEQSICIQQNIKKRSDFISLPSIFVPSFIFTFLGRYPRYSFIYFLNSSDCFFHIHYFIRLVLISTPPIFFPRLPFFLTSLSHVVLTFLSVISFIGSCVPLALTGCHYSMTLSMITFYYWPHLSCHLHEHFLF